VKTSPVIPATIEFDAEGVPCAPAFGDRYHARAGALAQAEHVFLRGNGLPRRWAGCTRFTVLETGFGLGLNFLATWAAWREDAARPERLHYVAVERHPPRREDLQRVHAAMRANGAAGVIEGGMARGTPQIVAPAAQLQAAWPPLTGDLHRLAFEQGRVELLLAFGDAATWLRRLQLKADAIYLDGFAPERNAGMWSPALFGALPGLCAEGATAATWSVARAVRDGLSAQGFEVERAPGFADKREMTVARFAPRHRPPPNARQRSARPAARAAIVIGAGLAGAATAHALATQGLDVTVLEAAADVATGASGNPAGLVRGLVSRDDGAHARWHRAAALEAQRLIAPWLVAGPARSDMRGPVCGRLGGVLHFAGDFDTMQRQLAAGGWPSDYVQALDTHAASAQSGLERAGPAWLFPGGGWVDPAGLVRCLASSPAITLRTGCAVTGLRRLHAQRWQVLGAGGAVLAEAEIVVLANAADATRLAPAGAVAEWRLARSRGQVSWLPAGAAASWPQRPQVPLAGNGYVVPLPDGRVLCGATQSTDDDDGALREADHAHNLAVLQRLTGVTLRPGTLDTMAGRVAWRCHTDDRLPLVGALPAADIAGGEAAAPARAGQPRHVPREDGLFALTALGSRGITSAALGARVLAAWVCGAPLPIDTDLLDAVDAARHRARAARRAAAR